MIGRESFEQCVSQQSKIQVAGVHVYVARPALGMTRETALRRMSGGKPADSFGRMVRAVVDPAIANPYFGAALPMSSRT
jgi:hypothetical protein